MTENSLFQTFSWCGDRDLLQVSTVPGFESSLSHSVQGSSPAYLTVSRVRVQPISQCPGFESSLSHSVQGSSPAYLTVSRVRFQPFSQCTGFESSLFHSVQGSIPPYLTVSRVRVQPFSQCTGFESSLSHSDPEEWQGSWCNSMADPERFDVDPYPAFYLDTAPKSEFYLLVKTFTFLFLPFENIKCILYPSDRDLQHYCWGLSVSIGAP